MEEGNNGRGDRGSSSFFSLMEMTIFSRSIGVMCFSFALLPSLVSALRSSGRGASAAGATGSSTDEDDDSTLEESSGTASVAC